MEAFDEAVRDGVNANLCDAVVGLWGSDEAQHNLEFAFTWSPTRPVEHDSINRVTISSDRVPVIREAGYESPTRDGRANLPSAWWSATIGPGMGGVVT